MSWYVWIAIIAVIAFFTYVITVITGLFKRNADLTQENIDELVGDSYCASFIPMRAYFYLESADEPLFAEIHGNMKRYESRGCDD